MSFNVAEFRANLIGDGARPNLFQVTMAFPNFVPNAGTTSQSLTFLAKSAQLPGASIGTVPLYYFGRELKFPGNRTFANWSITIINDENFRVRKAFEAWSNAINAHAGNVRSGAISSPTTYSVDAKVDQFDKQGNIIKTYKFVGAFPTDYTPIDLDWGSNDAIEEFGVTLAYQWWESDTTS